MEAGASSAVLRFALSLCIALFALPIDASAQARRVRLQATAVGGFGSDVEEEADDTFGGPLYSGATRSQGASNDLMPTYGGALGVDVVLLAHLALGAEVGLAFWNSQVRAGRDGGERPFIQIDVLLRPRLPFSITDDLELYFVAPVGLTYFVPPGGKTWTLSGTKASRYEGGQGFAVGAGFGLAYFLAEHVGLHGEVGYLYRNFGGRLLEDHGYGAVAPFNETLSFGQGQLKLGLTIAF
jgi:hypothetical protein